MTKVIDFLFDSEWYVGHSPEGVLRIEAADAFEHYANHSQKTCWPPNEYLANHDDLLRSQGKCDISIWFEDNPADKSLDDRDHIKIKSILQHGIQSGYVVKLDEFLTKGHPNLRSIAISVLANCAQCIKIANTDTFEFLEDWLKPGAESKDAFFILMEHVTKYASDSSAAIYLTNAIAEDRFAYARQDLLSKLKILTRDGYPFLPQVFENLEQLVEIGVTDDVVHLLAYAAKYGSYIPKAKIIAHFKEALEASISISDPKPRIEAKKQKEEATLFLDALTGVVTSCLDQQTLDLNYVEKIIDYVIANEYRFIQTKYKMSPVLQKLVSLFKQTSKVGYASLINKIVQHDETVPSALIQSLGPEIKIPSQSDTLPKSLEILLKEIFELNKNNPTIYGDKLSKLIEYLKTQVMKVKAKHEELEFHKCRSIVFHYRNTRPMEINPSELHVYNKNNQLFVRVFDIDGILIDAPLSNISEEDEQTLQLLQSEGMSLEPIDLDTIYRATGYFSPWSDERFLSWVEHIKEVSDETIAEIIAVLNYVYHITVASEEYFIREQQILAILLLFKGEHGMLVESETGSGKTADITIFNAIQLIAGLRGYIITTSQTLAKRDAKKQGELYAKLGFSSDHNGFKKGESFSGLRECYDADALYNDPRILFGDTLRNLNEPVIRHERLDYLIVDEVDSMFFDQAIIKRTKIQLSAPIHGFEYLQWLLHISWQKLEQERASFVSILADSGFESNGGEYCRFMEVNITKTDLNNTVLVPQCIDVEQIHDKLKDGLIEYLNTIVRDRNVQIPRHLSDFIKGGHFKHWVDSLITALVKEEGVDYVIYQYNHRVIIAPVDAATGAIQTSLILSDALHQFLQMKHGLMQTPEGLTTVFMSYFGFLMKYQWKIRGLTGTFGELWHQKFLHQVYEVDLIKLPEFMESKRVKHPPIVAESSEVWLANIVSEVHKMGSLGRATLIIASSIKEMKLISKKLRESSYQGRIDEYFDGTKEEQEFLVERRLVKGQVIVATNAAGRGTDIKLRREVIKNGGLHVIVTWFPSSLRVFLQNIGRGGRNGEPGSYINIINAEYYADLSDACDYACLEKIRDEREIEDLDHMRICEKPGLLLEDELFRKHIQNVRNDTSTTGLEFVLGPTKLIEQNNSNTLLVFAQNNSLYIQPIEGSPINITNAAFQIDASVLTNMLRALSRNDSNLNNQEYELLHFIAANNGLSKKPDRIGRVIVSYEGLWPLKYEQPQEIHSGFCPAEQVYLTSLIDANKKTTAADLEAQKNIELNRLWREDSELYNEKLRIKQRNEQFGVFYRNNLHLMRSSDTCNAASTMTEGQLALDQKRWLQGNATVFFEFERNSTSLVNPSLLLKRAYDYERISSTQSSLSGEYLFKGSYKFFSESKTHCNVNTPKYDTGFWGGILGFVASSVRILMSPLDMFRSMQDGKVPINVYVENPLKLAMGDIEAAVRADDFYNFWAHNALGYMRIRKNGEEIQDRSQAKEAGNLIVALNKDWQGLRMKKSSSRKAE